MITVIIPTLNEEENVANVIKFAKQYSLVTEVLVVDDKSIDNTVRIAQDSGARVITSTRIGKGGSMREGVMFATNEVVVFLDA
ncbi:MAG: glycosyltransferase, partial [Bacteroidia bacterium]|nr:glycosyltransferase [Bacteroidia bacterium]